MRTRLFMTAAAAALAATTVTALAPPAGADAPPACDSTVVLHVGTGRGGFGQGGPEVTVFADGRVFFRSEPPGDAVTMTAITEQGIERILRKARKAGLLEQVDYGEADITDQGVTDFEIRDGNEHNRFSIYALYLGGAGYGPSGLGLTPEQHRHRARVARFADIATNPKTYERDERTEATPHIGHAYGSDLSEAACRPSSARQTRWVCSTTPTAAKRWSPTGAPRPSSVSPPPELD